MVDQKDSEAFLLMTILGEPNAETARRRYIKAFGLGEIDDQAVYEQVEARVFDSLMRRAPSVEIERELAQTMLLLLKKGIKRSKGGQRSTRAERLRKRTLVALGRRIKGDLISNGMNATEAHLQAAEEAAEEGTRHGVNFSANYLARQMDKADR